jgi:rhomboid family GlyGly-CTERM serine protease
MRSRMITAGMLRSSVKTGRVPLAVGALALLLQAFAPVTLPWLSMTRDGVEAGQLWRLISGHVVHLGWYHLALNLTGLAALLVLCPAPLSSREWLRRFVLVALGCSLALYAFAPDVSWYMGLSGLLHGLFLLGLVPMVLARDPIATAALAFLLAKLCWEQVAGVPLSDQQAIGGPVVTLAHLFGTLAALVYGFAFGVFRRGEPLQ